MIMRYQKMSPDGVLSSSSNGRRIGSSSWRIYREDDDDNNGAETNGTNNIACATPKISSFEGKGLSRFRSPSKNNQDHISSPHTPFVNSGGDANGFIATVGGVSSAHHIHQNHRQEESTATGSLSSEKSGGSPIRRGGDGLLQWGHRKRSRCSRSSEGGRIGVVVVRALNDHESSSSSPIQQHQQQPQHSTVAAVKIPKRSSMADKSSAITVNTMPPPLPNTSNGISNRRPILKSCAKDKSSTASPNRRNQDERSEVANASSTSNGGRGVSSRSKLGKRSPSVCEKFSRRNPQLSSEKINGCSSSVQQRLDSIITRQSEQAAVVTANVTKNDDDCNSVKISGGGEKANGGGETNEWPKIYIQLSRKEKEEDFFAMKGTKLPHRPKKRPKAIEKVLQYGYPGMWLSDLIKSRYEVREKKCTKKQQKRLGLKGMEILESESD